MRIRMLMMLTPKLREAMTQRTSMMLSIMQKRLCRTLRRQQVRLTTVAVMMHTAPQMTHIAMHEKLTDRVILMMPLIT